MSTPTDEPGLPAKKRFWPLKELKTPPLTAAIRRDAGFYINLVCEGVTLSMPISRPMPSIGPRCHELRLSDEAGDWRVVYRVDADLVLVVDTFKKTTEKTPLHVIRRCKRALDRYDAV